MSHLRVPDGIVLSIESTNPPGSVALGRGKQVISLIEAPEGGQLSESFLPLIHSMFEETGTEQRNLRAVIIGAGPGSFTGLRVGFSFALGIVESTGAKLFPIPILDVMAHNVPTGYEYAVPLLDARKGEVYGAFYRGGEAPYVRDGEYISINPENLIYRLISCNSFVLGPGYKKYGGIFNDRGVGPYDHEERFYPSPHAGKLLEYFYSKSECQEVSPLEAAPLYVRPSEAELKSGRRRK